MKKLSSLLVLIFCLIPFVASAWILRDEFNTALSAGSVHNTTSEPSGHTRTVTDTENKISIADGKLTFSGGKESPATGDPAIWYSAIDRVAGRMLMLDYAASSQLYSHFGWDNNQTTFTGAHTFGMTADFKYFSVEGSGSIATYNSGSNYKLSSILRANGQFAFMSENNAPWKLLWFNASSTITPLYPIITNHSSTFTSSFLRIPTTLWLPSPLASDGFGTAGVTDGLGHAEGVAGGIGEGGGGLAWQSGGSTWSVSEGKAVNTVPSGISQQVETVSASTADMLATVSIAAVSAGEKVGLVTNLDSVSNPQNYILAYHDGTNAKLDKIVSGSSTGVISAEAAFSANAELRVIKDGTTYRLYYNNALVGTATISDASIISNTRHGLFSTDASNTLDNFTLYARGTGGEYNILNNLMSTTVGGSLNLLGVGR